MTQQEALQMVCILADELRRGSGVSVSLEDGRFVFRSTKTGVHSVSVLASSPERVRAHFDGFMEWQPAEWQLPKVGDRVTFRRGMYGLWSGTVEAVSSPRLPLKRGREITVRFRRRQGDLGRLRIAGRELSPLQSSTPTAKEN